MGIALRGIVSTSAALKTHIDEVSTGSSEQTTGLDRIASAIGNFERGTQEDAASAEERAASSAQLSSHSQTLREIAATLGALVEKRPAAR
jgi:methyl-accepting chemotaxis protein